MHYGESIKAIGNEVSIRRCEALRPAPQVFGMFVNSISLNSSSVAKWCAVLAPYWQACTLPAVRIAPSWKVALACA